MNESHRNDIVLPKRYLNRNRLFLIFNTVFTLAFFGPLQDLARTSWSSEYYSYIPFIPFISAYLIYSDRKTIFSQKEESSSLPGLLAMGIGILLLFVATNHKMLLDSADYLSLITFFLITLWIGGFAFCFGIRSTHEAAFPLLFLLFAVPIPNALLESIILFLQTGSAEISYIFFQAAGIPIARDGFIFHLPGLDIEVAKQCSGIRSSLSLVITGALAAYFFLRTGWARILLMISIVPFAIVKNGIRIFTLTTLGVYWDARIIDSDLHRKGGFVFFLIALVLVGGVIAVLRKAERKFASKDNNHEEKA